MKTLEYAVDINAPKEKVWKILWNEDTFTQWTSAFTESSKATSDWMEGSSVLFTDGKGNGMYSIIKKQVPNKQMTFKHLGVLEDGEEVAVNNEMQSWTGSLEEYQLMENDGVTKVKVSLDATEEYTDYFNASFPKALQKVKQLSEN